MGEADETSKAPEHVFAWFGGEIGTAMPWSLGYPALALRDLGGSRFPSGHGLQAVRQPVPFCQAPFEVLERSLRGLQRLGKACILHRGTSQRGDPLLQARQRLDQAEVESVEGCQLRFSNCVKIEDPGEPVAGEADPIRQRVEEARHPVESRQSFQLPRLGEASLCPFQEGNQLDDEPRQISERPCTP